MNKQNNSAAISRRQLLKATAIAGTAMAGGSTLLPSSVWAAGKNQDAAIAGTETWISAQGNADTGYFASWITDGEYQPLVQSAASGFRGHALAQHTGRPELLVMFARRPGTHALVVNMLTGEVEQRIDCAEHHHMHGHGCFDQTGELLFTTESNYQTGVGKLVIRNTRSWQVEGEFLTHGIGPHDVHLMSDQKTLVVANGGLLTHPDSGRKVLNLDTMDPSLVYLSLYNGELISQHRLPESKASIRHLAVANDGTVAVATQLQRPAMTDNRLVPLGAIHKPGAEMQLLQCPESLTVAFNDYMGSVAINEKERVAGFTSPRGDIAAFWHMDRGELVGYHPFHDVCGLTVTRDQQYFVMSNSKGDIRLLDALSMKEDRSHRLSFAGKHWDNHMFTITLPDQAV